MSPDQEPILVELVSCPTNLPRPQGTLAEMPYRASAWTPEDLRTLKRLFAEDAAVEEIALALGRGRAGVADRICVLGLRRHSTRPWTAMEDADLSRRYGQIATATIASEFGRSCAAVYARAGLLDLTEGHAPPWTDWEDAQLRAGYAGDVPTAKIASIIGRPHCGLVSRASKLGLRHPSHSPDWSIAEIERAIALSEAGHRYADIRRQLAEAGFPQRSRPAFQAMMNRTGHGTGWGRFWTQEEDALLTRAYQTGASLTLLRHRLGRSQFSIRWRSEYLGLRGTHAHRNGWRTAPDWTEADIARLRAEYGKTSTPELASQMGRTRASLTTRANVMGLVHGYHRAWTPDEHRALALAHEHDVAVSDLAVALGRKFAGVHKYATKRGFVFGRRPRRDPAPTLAGLLALDGS